MGSDREPLADMWARQWQERALKAEAQLDVAAKAQAASTLDLMQRCVTQEHVRVVTENDVLRRALGEVGEVAALMESTGLAFSVHSPGSLIAHPPPWWNGKKDDHWFIQAFDHSRRSHYLGSGKTPALAYEDICEGMRKDECAPPALSPREGGGDGG